MYSLSNLWNASPARIVAVVMSILLVIGTYGLNIVPDPDKFQTALVGVLTLLAGGEVTRSQMTSPATAKRLGIKK